MTIKAQIDVKHGSNLEPITPLEAKCIRIALAFGDPSGVDLPDPDLERAKAKLKAIEKGDLS